MSRKITMSFIFILILSSCVSTTIEDLGEGYIAGKDDQPHFSSETTGSLVESETHFYFHQGDYIYAISKVNMEATPLCNKPDCLHNKETDYSRLEYCNAYVGISFAGMEYHEDSLYIDYWDIKSTPTQYALHKVNIDGSGHTEILRSGLVSDFLIHRGILYLPYTDFLRIPTEATNLDEYAERMKTMSYGIRAYDLSDMSKEPVHILEKTGKWGQIGVGMTAFGNHIIFRTGVFEDVLSNSDYDALIDESWSLDIRTNKVRRLEKPTRSRVARVGDSLLYFSKNSQDTDYKAVLAALDGAVTGEMDFEHVDRVFSNGNIIALDNENYVISEEIPPEERCVRFYSSQGEMIAEVFPQNGTAHSLGLSQDYFFYLKESSVSTEAKNIYALWVIDLQNLYDPNLEGQMIFEHMPVDIA